MKIQEIRQKDKGFYLICLDEGKDLILHGEIVDKVPEDQLIPRLMELIDTL